MTFVAARLLLLLFSGRPAGTMPVCLDHPLSQARHHITLLLPPRRGRVSHVTYRRPNPPPSNVARALMRV